MTRCIKGIRVSRGNGKLPACENKAVTAASSKIRNREEIFGAPPNKGAIHPAPLQILTPKTIQGKQLPVEWPLSGCSLPQILMLSGSRTTSLQTAVPERQLKLNQGQGTSISWKTSAFLWFTETFMTSQTIWKSNTHGLHLPHALWALVAQTLEI